MLVSCEVAVEYYLALIHSPQVRGRAELLHCSWACLPADCGSKGLQRLTCKRKWRSAAAVIHTFDRPSVPRQPLPSNLTHMARLRPACSLLPDPQIQWLQQTEQAWPLQVEVDSEVDAAYRFIIDRWAFPVCCCGGCEWIHNLCAAGPSMRQARSRHAFAACCLQQACA